MPRTFTDITAPIKGVVKIRPFQDHNPDAALDSSNVVPFDTEGRFRVSQRTGTVKTSETVLGSGSQPVQYLAAITRALDPTLIAPSVAALIEPFTYSNGFIGAVASAKWTGRSTTSAVSAPYAALNSAYNTTTVGVSIVSNQAALTAAAASSSNHFIATYTGPVLTLGSSYVVKFKMYANASASTANSPDSVSLFLRVPSSGTDPRGIMNIQFSLSCPVNGSLRVFRVRVDEATTNGTSGETNRLLITNTSGYGNGTFTSASPAQIEVQYVAGVIKILIDGAVVGSATIGYTASSATGLAFRIGGNTPLVNIAAVDDFEVYTGASLASYRQTDTVAVCGGNIYVGPKGTAYTITTGGTAALLDVGKPAGAFQYGLGYFVDGINARVLDLSSRTVSAWTPTAGTETNASLAKFTVACTWRGRIVLGASVDNPQNFLMSKVGDPLNFDYADTTAAAAVAGNAARTGYIGEPIVALLPASDDSLFIGGDHNLWLIHGDLADGGSIDLISDAIGMLGPQAWTKSPDGTIYFLGTGGLFRMTPGGSAPENISNDKWNEYFAQIDRGAYYALLEWDRDNYQVHVFLTPVNPTTAIHLIYDIRLQSFWPMTYPNSHGPVCTYLYDGDAATDRAILLGGRDGYIRKFSSTATNDDGTAISSYIVLGPVKSSDIDNITVGELHLIFARAQTGVTDFNCSVSLQVGPTVQLAVESPTRTTTVVYTSYGRQVPWLRRVSGQTAVLKLANSTIDKGWCFEKASVGIEPTGRVRRLT